ncbi:NACHT, LRR and PYD domains-containing protein 3-like [Discoglossus pictus]
MTTHGDILHKHLSNLSSRDLKTFKDKLVDSESRNNLQIPHESLENADVIDTKNLLIKSCGEKAVEVTIDVFKAIGWKGKAESLQEDTYEHQGHQAKELEKCRIEYKESVAVKYRTIRAHNAHLGEHDTIKYTNLLMIKNLCDDEERGLDILSLGRKHLVIMNRASYEYYPMTIQTLFEPGEWSETVVLQGPAGIGKTTIVQKIMFEWASGNLYQQKFNYVFCLSCREINNVKGKMTLSGFLSNICNLRCSENVIKSILEDSSDILVIIDGLDELKWQIEKTTGACVNPFQETSMKDLVNSILRKTILQRASLIITTRPYTLEKLKECIQSACYVDAIGFNEKSRVEYFYTILQNKIQAERAVEIIKENITLFTMCVVPVTCWIVCTVMNQQMERGLNEVKTTTSVYWLYVKSLIKHHGRDSHQSVLGCVKELCALAMDGVMEQKILFDENDITDHGLSMSEITSVFVNENIFHKETDCDTTYSFIHFSVQEFFAALYFLLGGDKESSGSSEGPNKEVMGLLENSLKKHHLRLTVRFLFGLCSEKQRKAIEEVLGCKISMNIKCTLEQWMVERLESVHDDIMNYLYESQEEDFIRRMMSHYKKLGFYRGNPKYAAISYCLMNSPRHDHYICFLCNPINIKTLEILSPGLMKCAEIQLIYCDLTPSCCKDLQDVITTNRSLITLDLSNNEFGDSGVKPLCDGLKHPDCTIQELRLAECDLTSLCCEDLQDVITTNRSLIKLDLSSNILLGDSGVKRLCDGLKHPECTIQELRLVGCNLTSSCCEDLQDVITTNRSLLKLDLISNGLGDSGVKRLCDGLKHPDCTIQELMLSGCDLTSSCCEDLQDVITTNRSLIKLDLTGNGLGDSGIKRLCDGLKHPDCIIQELRLDTCELTSSCCEDLQDVITTNRSLIKLGLTSNELGDSGVKYLCDGLKHPDCTIQDLRLDDCDLSSSCCEDLQDVITTNRSLLKLGLIANGLGDSGVERLCDGLKHPDCTIQDLGLAECDLTSLCCEGLQDVITTNRSLIKLGLSWNKLGDSGIKLLCNGLKHPDCTIQELRLEQCDLTSSCCEDLQDVITTNRSLIKLDLGFNKLGDSGEKLLCDVLKHPDCTIQELR